MATRNCANCSYAEVNNAINGVAGGGGTWTGFPAADGDIIVLPSNKATSGTFTITYGASTSSAIAHDASNTAVRDALNAMASITSDGGVTVVKVSHGFYEVTWVTNGARTTPWSGTSSLVPLNNVMAGVKTAGITTSKEVRVIIFGSSWTTTLNIGVGITFQGSTTVTGDHTVAPGSWTTADETIILDDIVLVSGKGPMIKATLEKDDVFMITGITFRRGARLTKAPEPGAITLTGECPEDSGGVGLGSIRIHHCHFDQLGQIGQWWGGWTYGLTDHCKWTCGTTGQTTQGLSMNNGETWGGGVLNGEIGSWVYPTMFGTDKFAFVEDCLFYNLGTGQTAGKIDGQYGGRFVLRYSQYYNTSVIGGHGTESGGFHRGVRAAEYYNIERTGPTSQSWGEQRSGVRLIHHNTWGGPGGSGTSANIHREFWSFKFGGATGNCSWDQNDTDGDGTWTEGAAPHLYASGTASINSVPTGTTAVLTVTGTPFSGKDFTGMMLQNVDQPNGLSGPVPCIILSNTANTITFSTDDGGYYTAPGIPPSKQFVAGEHFAVYQVLAALDQVGYGQCADRIYTDDGVPYNFTYGDQRWPHQARDPIYCWQNYAGSTLVTTSSSMPTALENREFYNQDDTFTGSTGIGVGLLSARPSSGLAAGVGYWATDTSRLYIATSATTWTTDANSYTPYQYPHPLTGAAAGKIILLTGALHFGNVIIGENSSANVNCANTGADDDLVVTSVSSSSLKFVLASTAGFTVAPGESHDILVTYTPTTETLDNCTITFDSNADSGTETIAASGTGVAPAPPPGGKGKGHKKGVLVARGR